MKPWQHGIELDELKRMAAPFKTANARHVYGAFGLVKERDVASAISEGSFVQVKSAAAFVRDIERPHKVKLFAGAQYILLPDTMFISELGYVNLKDVSALIKRIRRSGSKYLAASVFQEDAALCTLLRDEGLVFVGAKVMAGSEIKGLYVDNATRPKSDPAELVTLKTLVPRFIDSDEIEEIKLEIDKAEREDRVWAQHYCVEVSQRVLTADLRWVPAGELKLGDRLVGFDEEPRPGERRKFCETEVTAYAWRKEEVYRVRLDDGTDLLATAEHPWLAIEGTGQKWKRTDRLRPGDRLPRLFSPWDHPTSFDSGWMAGILDGEGYVGRYFRTNENGRQVSSARLGFAQLPGSVLDYALRLLDEWGIRHRVAPPRPGGVVEVGVDRKAEAARLVGMTRPVRLLPKITPEWLGVVRADYHAAVVSIESIGIRPIAAMSTSTSTYVSEGFGSHNSSYNKRRSWTAFALRGYVPENPSFIIKPAEMSKKWKEDNPELLKAEARNTVLADDFPFTMGIVNRIEGEKDRVRFMRLSGNGELTRHADITDREAGVQIGNVVRLHIPIVTRKEILFSGWNLNGTKSQLHFAQGALCYLDQRKPHAVFNPSKKDRIHLVIDCRCTEGLRKLIAR
jgi:hypothetical protein